jgi:superfamily II helicase
METTKKCSHCGEIKPIDEFYKNTSYKDGHLNVCKTCTSESQRASRKRKEGDKDNPLASFTSRKLLEELRDRGYRGKLVYQQEIDLQRL